MLRVEAWAGVDWGDVVSWPDLAPMDAAPQHRGAGRWALGSEP
jgi:hypothetical protein